MRSRTVGPLVLIIALGITAGIGAYTFVYAKGGSYFGSDPRMCVNCHIMREQYDGWITSSHRAVATCNDCHAPHTLVGKYVTKGINGFWHSVAFTTGRFHEPIAIGARNREVTESTCRYCHSDLVESIDGHGAPEARTACLRCHRSVGHLH